MTTLALVTTSLRGAAAAAPEVLRPVANLCSAGSCPTVYATDSDTGTVVVQGFTMTPGSAGLDLPEGESLVRVPLALLAEALRNLS